VKIFLDVGAHTGETLPAVLDPRFAFDRVVCFEPAPACWPRLRRVQDTRVSVEPFGLWRDTTLMTLHDPGEIGASLFEKKYSHGTDNEQIMVVKASDWFAGNLRREDEVYAKLNVEGAEADILEDLIATGEITKLSALLVHLDIRKVPSQRERADEIVAALERSGIPFAVADPAGGPSHVARVHVWLEESGASARAMTLGARARSARIRFRYIALPSASRALRLGKLVQTLFGKRIHLKIRSRVLGYEFDHQKIRTKHH
jgi:FkbM family methyltransferase